MMNRDIGKVCDRAEELGKRYEVECTGCAQSTIAAILDALEIENDELFKAASGLADGIGLTGNGSCGALVGGVMVLGWLYGRERKDFQDMFKPMFSYQLAKELHDRFVEQFGHCRCHNLQAQVCGRAYNFWKPGEIEQAMADGAMHHCAKVVGACARMTTEIILKQPEAAED
jgi:C_GCAxxG_C_C family probable redox protein